MTKKISTPVKPPGNQDGAKWFVTTANTAIPRRPSISLRNVLPEPGIAIDCGSLWGPAAKLTLPALRIGEYNSEYTSAAAARFV